MRAVVLSIALCSVVVVHVANGFQIKMEQPTLMTTIASQTKKVATAAVLCSTLVFVGLPMNAAGANVPPLENALIEASDASYPIIKSLTPETLAPLANKLVSLFVKKVPSDQFTNLLNHGIDAFLSIPDENVASFTAVVKDGYVDLSTDSCDLVPLPSVDVATKLASSEGVMNVDSAKKKAFVEKFDPTFQAFKKTEVAICLPSQSNLEKLFIAQTDLTFAINRNEVKAFGEAVGSAVKTIPSSDLLRLLPDIKNTEKGVNPKARNRFEMAGKELDKTLKRDPRFARLIK